ncbi:MULTISPECIES: ABC transporter permease [Terrabacteria group]|uniref:ABC transporter permease n=1 Tax=Bacillati TaxID=1783272 RepID=UPI001C6EA628|nr:MULTISPECIES: ABC transporter permease [Terrabacteria group]MBW9212125.1 ABC transporter permease [Trueperella sp. zg.1013]
MSRYVIGRLIRSVFSIVAVVIIALTLVYTQIDRSKIFQQDPTWVKLNDEDSKTRYMNSVYQRLGYLDFKEQGDICRGKGDGCMVTNSNEAKVAFDELKNKGYTVKTYRTGLYYATKEYSILDLVKNWFGHLIEVDHPWRVSDDQNPNLERKFYIENDYNGLPAIKGSGTVHKYLLYFDDKFPFIHQNFIGLNFGVSYPTFGGVDVKDVLTQTQGSSKPLPITFETGKKANSALQLHACKYKATSTMDDLDKGRFLDNYANCDNLHADPSMIATSMMMGIIALIITYLIGIPAGMTMASHKDKWQDKLGTIYINVMSAVPSLAFIYFVQFIGLKIGLPDKFPTLGAHNIRSYIIPVLILGLMSTGGIMMWMRRFMLDQASSDYVKFARAKGLSQREIFRKHILRNASIPLVNGIPAAVILTISGAVITETVFAIPGMGKMLPDAIKAYNNPMVIAITFILTTLSIISLLLGDLLVTVVDPRIQLTSKGESR